MRVLMLVLMVGITLASIYVGSKDAARRKTDREKYGGDELIKAISEYNEKTNALRGHVGGVGVTRTPMTTGTTGKGGTLRFGSSGSQQRALPSYMINRPPGQAASPYSREVNPYQPQFNKSTPYPPAPQSGAGSGNAGSSGGGDYYPPPPVSPGGSQMGNAYPPQSRLTQPYVVPMNLPKQPLREDKLYLRSGQKLGFAGTKVYTYDDKGNPIRMPDGYYKIGDRQIHIKNGKNVIYE